MGPCACTQTRIDASSPAPPHLASGNEPRRNAPRPPAPKRMGFGLPAILRGQNPHEGFRHARTEARNTGGEGVL
jgi:hypothetical protein